MEPVLAVAPAIQDSAFLTLSADVLTLALPVGLLPLSAFVPISEPHGTSELPFLSCQSRLFEHHALRC